jgi:hypothetical protein
MVGLVAAGSASAAELFTVNHPSYQALMPDGPRDVYITQNNNTTQIDPVQVACGVAGTYTTQNYFLRRFFLADDHGITTSVQVTGVFFGIEQLDMADGSTPPPYVVTIRLYSIPAGAAFTFASMTQVGSATVTLHASDIGTIVFAYVDGFLSDPTGHDLVVAVDAPDGSAIGAGLQFRPGANTFGAIQDAYIATADCGISDPIGVSDIGFPDSQTIFVVSFTAGIGNPTQTTSWGHVKGLYR